MNDMTAQQTILGEVLTGTTSGGETLVDVPAGASPADECLALRCRAL